MTHDPEHHGHRGDDPQVVAAGAVVLDIGGDVGAVVVYLADQAVGAELDIQPVGEPAGRFHTGVHDRLIDGATTRVAVFPEVRAATYELLDEHAQPFVQVEAVGGEVRTLDLR